MDDGTGWCSHAAWWNPRTWGSGHAIDVRVLGPGNALPPCRCCGALHDNEFADVREPSAWSEVDTGLYYWGVVSIGNRGGYSDVRRSTQQAIRAGEHARLTIIPPMSDLVSRFAIFRSRKNGISLEMQRVAQVEVSGHDPVNYRDINVYSPETLTWSRWQ